MSSPPKFVSRVRLKSIVALGLSSVLLASGLVTGAQQSALANGACTSGTTSNAFSGGDGQSAATAWEIATASDLIRLSEITASSGGVASFRDDYYKQTADIDLAGCTFQPIGFKTQISLHFDGGGFVTDNLTITEPSLFDLGFFAWMNGGSVRNLGLTNVDISGQGNTGGLIGRMRAYELSGVMVDSVYVTGTVSGGGSNGVGGMIGALLADKNRTARISNSFADVAVDNDNNASAGLIGQVIVTGAADLAEVGQIEIENTYSIGAVINPNRGRGHTGTLSFTTPTSGVPGIIVDTENFWNTDTSLKTASAVGTGNATAEMRSAATYSAWDIVDGWEAFNFDSPTNYWGICSDVSVNGGYPFLLWQYDAHPCPPAQNDNSGGTGGGGAPAAVMAAPPVPAPAPQRVLPRAPVTPPLALSGPVLRAGGSASVPPQAPGAFIGGVPTVLQQTVPDSTRLSLATGSVALDMTVASGSGASSTDGVTQLGVKNRSSIELAGSGLLPGSTVQVFIPLSAEDSRELAQLVVNPDGTFSGAAAFSTDPLAAPLPIGPRLLQLVTIDEEGNQVVLEMTVAIEQGDPNPELNRELGDIPTMPLGSLEATSAGLPIEANITAIADQKLAIVEGDGWTMAVNIDSPDGAVEETETGAALKLVRDETALVSGSGFMAGTRADVWLFSEPTLVGTVTIDENGEFTGEVDVDPNLIPAGEHTLQLQGVGTDGYVKAANLGVLVEDAGVTPSVAEESSFSWTFLWWILLVIVVLLILWFVVRRRRSGSRA